MSQEISAATEESKKKYIPRDFSQAKEACFYFKISACFSKPPAKFAGWILALKLPQKKSSVWIFSKARSFFQDGGRCCSGGWKCPVAELRPSMQGQCTGHPVQSNPHCRCFVSFLGAYLDTFDLIHWHQWCKHNWQAASQGHPLSQAGRRAVPWGTPSFSLILVVIFSPNIQPKSLFLLLPLSSLHLLSTNHPSLGFSPMLIDSSSNAPFYSYNIPIFFLSLMLMGIFNLFQNGLMNQQFYLPCSIPNPRSQHR